MANPSPPAVRSLIEAAQRAGEVVQALAAYREDVNLDHLIARAVDAEPALTAALDEFGIVPFLPEEDL